MRVATIRNDLATTTRVMLTKNQELEIHDLMINAINRFTVRKV